MHLKVEVRLLYSVIGRYQQMDLVCRLKPSDVQVLGLHIEGVIDSQVDCRYILAFKVSVLLA